MACVWLNKMSCWLSVCICVDFYYCNLCGVMINNGIVIKRHVAHYYFDSLDCGHSREAVYYWCQSVEDAFRWLSGLLQHPHPFVCCRGDATLRDAHRQMTNYCCRFNLVQLLWMYYSVHRCVSFCLCIGYRCTPYGY